MIEGAIAASARRASGMRIALSGASGFIGSVLDAELAMRGFEVLPVSRAELEPMRSGADASQRLAGCTTAVHLAARVHVLGETENDPIAEFRAANRDTTLAFARACAKASVRRFVFVSTIGVNGTVSTRPFRPDDPPAPEGPYAVSKLEAERDLWALATATGLEVVVVRPPLVYGPQAKGNFLRLLKLVATPLPLPLASISGKRSLISVWNLSDLLIRCIEHPNAAGRVLLAGDGEDIELPELIRRLSAAMGRPARLLAVPEELLRRLTGLFGLRRTFDKFTASLQVDISETRKVLQWTAPVSLHDGLARTAQWYIDSRNRSAVA